MILAFDMSVELFPVEVNITEIAGCISRHLIAEMWRLGIAAFSTRGYGSSADLRAELHGRDEAITGRTSF